MRETVAAFVMKRRIALPKKFKHPCNYTGCPKLTNHRFCPVHAKQETRRYNQYDRDPDYNKRYGRRWKKIRAAYISESPICEMCGRNGRLKPATIVHHIKPIRESNDNSYANLMSVCGNCHARIHCADKSTYKY